MQALQISEKARNTLLSVSQTVLVAVLLVLVTMSATPARAQKAQLQRLLELDAAYMQYKAANRWDLAAQAGEDMLAIARDYRISKMIELAAMDQLANARLNLAEYAEAEKLYQEVVEGAKATRGTDDDEVRSLRLITFNGLTGLGRVYREQDDQTVAVDYFQQAIAFAQQNGMSLEAAQGTTDLAFSLTELRREDEAIAAMLKQLPVLKRSWDPRKTHDPNNTAYANGLHCLAFTYDQMGRYDLAEPYHLGSLDVILANVGSNHGFTATVIDSMAAAFAAQGRVAEAEELYKIEIGIYEDSNLREHPRCAVAMNNLARLLEIDRGKHTEAEEMAREAVRIRRKFYDEDNAEVAISLVNLANILTFQDRWGEAEPIAAEAFEIYKKTYGLEHPETAQCMQLLASCYGMKGNWQKALKTLDQALEGDKKRPFKLSVTAMLYASKALALQQLGRDKEAAAALEEALKLLEIQRTYSAGAERERAMFLAKYAAFYDRAIEQQAAFKNTDAMFALSEQVKARSFLDELQTQNADLLVGVPEAERRELTAEEARLRQQLSQATAKLEAWPELGPKATEEQVQARDAAVQAVIEARIALYDHVVKVKATSKVYRELLANPTETATLTKLQESLDDGELVLSYTVGEFKSFVFTIRKTKVNVTELTLDEPTAKLFGVKAGPLTRDKLAAMLLEKEGGVVPALSNPKEVPNGFLDKLAALWTLLVPADEREALVSDNEAKTNDVKAVKRLTILPTDALSLLPFETLVVRRQVTIEYLLEVGPPIAYAPSASVLLNLARRDDPHEAADAPIFTLGNPAYPQTDKNANGQKRNTGTTSAERAGLKLLPFSGWEANWVRDKFTAAGLNAMLVTGADATEAAVRRESGGRKIVHLACHGGAEQSYSNFFGALYLMPGRPGDPTDDGTLSMSEIYGLDFAGCELAILSACETNYGPEQRGEGVWALSRGFLVAGARRVLASNWVVNDEAEATLVSHFVSYLCNSGKDPASYDYATALQQAKRAVRKDPNWAHPFFWGSLVLIGPK